MTETATRNQPEPRSRARVGSPDPHDDAEAHAAGHAVYLPANRSTVEHGMGFAIVHTPTVEVVYVQR